MVNNNPNNVKSISDLTPEELKEELKTSFEGGDMKRVSEISAEMVKRNTAESAEVKLKTEHEDLLKKIEANPKNIKKEDLVKFITEDLKDYRSDTEKWIKNIQEFKDKKIAELEAQLEDKKKTITEKDKEIAEKDSVQNLLSGVPGLHDISFKTWSLVKTGKRLSEMEEKGKSPKSILTYCMVVTQRQILWVRTSMKGAFAKLFRKRKWTSIIKNDELSKIKDALQPNPNSKAKFQEALKKVLLTTIEKQQERYADETREQITGKKAA